MTSYSEHQLLLYYYSSTPRGCACKSQTLPMGQKGW